MNALALVLWVSAFGSFGWGVLRFFRKPAGFTWHTRFVAAFGLACGLWHLTAVATTTGGAVPQAIGSACFAISAALFWSAVAACDSRPLTAIFEDDVPVVLVRTGPYRYVRHPFYASYSVFWFGGAVTSMSRVAFVSAAVMLGIYLRAIRREELKFAGSALAAEYRAYRRVAGLMLPGRALLERIFRG